MKLVLKYYDQETDEILEELDLHLDNNTFDAEVANKFVADFDRCEHGRHGTDVCFDCQTAYNTMLSRGNPGSHEEKWYDNQGNRIYAFGVGGTSGWVVIDGVLGMTRDL